MEIYTEQLSSIDIKVPATASMFTYEITRGGERVAYGSAQAASGVVSVQIPYKLTTYENTLDVKVSFTIEGERSSKQVRVDVVTPLLDIDEVKSIISNNPLNVTDERAKDIERKVRLTIQAYTGQVFGKYKGFVRVYGTGDGVLKSTRRIIDIDSVVFNNVAYSSRSYLIKGEGWTVERAVGYPLSIKQAPPEEVLDSYPYYSGAPISSPNATYFNVFNKKIIYSIYGTFGYESVPVTVQEAARLLVNDYGCDESTYRERYIGNIRAADWRFEFKDGAFAGTGNVVADQLLSEFKISNMVVI